MKKIIALSFMAAVSLILTSCSDDDPGTPDKKGYTVKSGENFQISNKYTLDGPLLVKSGGKLTIAQGTEINATGGTSSYVAVEKGAQIFVNGTKDNPVVMTSATKLPGSWGGVVICGEAPVNTGASSVSEVADLPYGGSKSDDNSGSITYLRVEYTGAKFTAKKEFNGISFFGVGSGTIVNNISSVASSDDGVEFFGGTVNATNIVSIDSEDDSLDFADGYNGTITNVYISGVTKAGIEGSNNGKDGNATPVTKATVKNVSIVKGNKGGSEGAIFFKEGGGEITYQNIYVDGLNLGIKVDGDDQPANDRVAAKKLQVNPIQFANKPADFKLGVTVEGVVTEANNTGAGAGADMPEWAKGWAK